MCAPHKRGIEPCSAEFAFQTLRFFVTKSPSPKVSIRPFLIVVILLMIKPF